MKYYCRFEGCEQKQWYQEDRVVQHCRDEHNVSEPNRRDFEDETGREKRLAREAAAAEHERARVESVVEYEMERWREDLDDILGADDFVAACRGVR